MLYVFYGIMVYIFFFFSIYIKQYYNYNLNLFITSYVLLHKTYKNLKILLNITCALFNFRVSLPLTTSNNKR